MRLQKKNFFQGGAYFRGNIQLFNYKPPLVLKPQSVEIGGAYFRVSTVLVVEDLG